MELDYRLIIAVSVFSLMLILEWLRPIQSLSEKRLQRWFVNIGIGVINIILVRLLGAGIVILCAKYAQTYQVGLLHWLQVCHWLVGWGYVVLGVLVLDFAIYWQHVASHRFDLLWRLHKVHHSDINLDTSSAIRFHPIEILLSLLYKAVIVIIFGIDAVSVLIFEILLNAFSFFNHANFLLPNSLDSFLKRWLITPSIHRIHHTVIRNEINSNYGFSTTLWDRLFDTYRTTSKYPQRQMHLGLKEQPVPLSLAKLLKFPFDDWIRQIRRK